jgi:hypothetical protein
MQTKTLQNTLVLADHVLRQPGLEYETGRHRYGTRIMRLQCRGRKVDGYLQSSPRRGD